MHVSLSCRLLTYCIGLSQVIIIEQGLDVCTRLGPFRHDVSAVDEDVPETILVDRFLGHLEGKARDGQGVG